jgi:hypothetical protein
MGIALAIGVSACAGWDGVVGLSREVPPDPPGGPVLHLRDVTDRRVFADVSHARAEPSLSKAIRDVPGIASRVIGRQRSNRGANLLLAEGRSVEALVAEVVTTALRGSGFRVAEEEGASPIDVDILELWAFDLRLDPVNRKRVEFRTRIRLVGGPSPFDDAGFACGRAETTSGGPTAGLWEKLIDSGLDTLATDISDQLATPDTPPPVWECQPSPGLAERRPRLRDLLRGVAGEVQGRRPVARAETRLALQLAQEDRRLGEAVPDRGQKGGRRIELAQDEAVDARAQSRQQLGLGGDR